MKIHIGLDVHYQAGNVVGRGSVAERRELGCNQAQRRSPTTHSQKDDLLADQQAATAAGYRLKREGEKLSRTPYSLGRDLFNARGLADLETVWGAAVRAVRKMIWGPRPRIDESRELEDPQGVNLSG